MTKVKGILPGVNARLALRGVVAFHKMPNGTMVIRKWPRKRGPNRPASQVRASQDFSKVVALIKNPIPEDYAAAAALSKGTGLLPRDILMKAAYGTLIVATMKDGTVWMGARMANLLPSAYLDTIDDTVGIVLYRASTGWVSLKPGTAGQVLQTNGPNAAPSWVDASGGGGGGSNAYAQAAATQQGAYTTTTLAFATLGNIIKPLTAITLTKVFVGIGNAVSGQRYRVGIYTINSSRVIQTVEQVVDVTAVSSGLQTSAFVMPTAVVLAAGTIYCIAVTGLDLATDTTPVPLQHTTQAQGPAWACLPSDAAMALSPFYDYRLASRAPAVGDTFTQGAELFASSVGLLATF